MQAATWVATSRLPQPGTPGRVPSPFWIFSTVVARGFSSQSGMCTLAASIWVAQDFHHSGLRTSISAGGPAGGGFFGEAAAAGGACGALVVAGACWAFGAAGLAGGGGGPTGGGGGGGAKVTLASLMFRGSMTFMPSSR